MAQSVSREEATLPQSAGPGSGSGVAARRHAVEALGTFFLVFKMETGVLDGVVFAPLAAHALSRATSWMHRHGDPR